MWATSTAALALDHNLFRTNNGGGSMQQYATAGTLLDMGSNVCADHMPCP